MKDVGYRVRVAIGAAAIGKAQKIQMMSWEKVLLQACRADEYVSNDTFVAIIEWILALFRRCELQL